MPDDDIAQVGPTLTQALRAEEYRSAELLRDCNDDSAADVSGELEADA